VRQSGQPQLWWCTALAHDPQKRHDVHTNLPRTRALSCPIVSVLYSSWRRQPSSITCLPRAYLTQYRGSQDCFDVHTRPLLMSTVHRLAASPIIRYRRDQCEPCAIVRELHNCSNRESIHCLDVYSSSLFTSIVQIQLRSSRHS